jgi:hypothetical protein
MSTLKMIGGASALFKALGQIDKTADRSQTIEQRARFYKLHPGLYFPEDWDELSDDDKEKRLDLLDNIALGRDDN